MDRVTCLHGDGECALCLARRAENDPRGWLPHPSSPDAAARILGPAAEPEAEAG